MLRFQEMGSQNNFAVSIHHLSVNVSFLKNRTGLKSFIGKQAKMSGYKSLDLSIICCSDDYLLTINKKFLNHAYYTDVITFDLSEKLSLRGEIYISIDRVRENAGLFGVSIAEELHRVIFHGFLHLLGFSDKSPKEQAIMRKQENALLKAYFGRMFHVKPAS
jgi:rRNA maturation RNase YbeY